MSILSKIVTFLGFKKPTQHNVVPAIPKSPKTVNWSCQGLKIKEALEKIKDWNEITVEPPGWFYVNLKVPNLSCPLTYHTFFSRESIISEVRVKGLGLALSKEESRELGAIVRKLEYAFECARELAQKQQEAELFKKYFPDC